MPRILSGESDYVKIFSRGIARGFGGLREYTAYNYLTTLIHCIILIKLIMATSKKKLKVSHKGDEGSVFFCAPERGTGDDSPAEFVRNSK